MSGVSPHALTAVLNLGFSGYRRIMQNNLAKARVVSRALEQSGWFTCLSQIHHPKSSPGSASDDTAEYYAEGLPVVSFRFSDQFKKDYPGIKQAWIQLQLRSIGWIVPNYPLPPNCEDTEILRVVVRESLSGDLARKLIADIFQV